MPRPANLPCLLYFARDRQAGSSGPSTDIDIPPPAAAVSSALLAVECRIHKILSVSALRKGNGARVPNRPGTTLTDSEAGGCSLLSMLFGCTSHAVPDIGSSVRPFAFRQLDHHPEPSFTQAFISPGPSSAGARMLRLPPPTIMMTFTINALPPTHELEFGLWVVTAWVSPGPSPPRRAASRDAAGRIY